jgi:hypothetical protein
MKEEERTHRQNVLALKYQKKHGELTDKEFDKKMKQEQKRHDRVVSEIKDDYNHHKEAAQGGAARAFSFLGKAFLHVQRACVTMEK